MFKIEHNVETGEIKQIELAPEEVTELETQYAEAKVKSDAAQAEVAARESARQALLTKLGITAEEAQLLLGGN
jgi:hypothetical protein